MNALENKVRGKQHLCACALTYSYLWRRRLPAAGFCAGSATCEEMCSSRAGVPSIHVAVLFASAGCRRNYAALLLQALAQWRRHLCRRPSRRLAWRGRRAKLAGSRTRGNNAFPGAGAKVSNRHFIGQWLPLWSGPQSPPAPFATLTLAHRCFLQSARTAAPLLRAGLRPCCSRTSGA